MKSIKTLSALFIASLLITGCSAKTNNKNAQSEQTPPTNYEAGIKGQLAKAKDNNRTVLVVVTDQDVSTEKIDDIISDAIKEMENVEVIPFNISGQEDIEFVNEYRLDNAPLPLILFFSDKGLMLGGMLEAQATKEAIIEAIPSPKFSEIAFALSQRKPVFAIVSNDKFKNDKAAKKACNAAQKEMKGNAEIVVIDTNDSKESQLIEMLNIKTELNDSFIVAINGQGIMSGRFDRIPSKTELVAAASQVVQSGCAPGGCGPTCN